MNETPYLSADDADDEQFIALAGEDKFEELLNGLTIGVDDHQKATTVLRQATESSNLEVRTRAWLGLGVCLEQLGDLQGARSAYQAAADAGHPEQSPKAAGDLGLMLQEHGDREGAIAAFRQAAEGNTEASAEAALNLGVLIADAGEGDIKLAKQWFAYAAEMGVGQGAAIAAFNLGTISYSEGNKEQAESWLRKAMGFKQYPEAGRAGLALGFVLKDRGDTHGAEQVWRQVVDGNFGDVTLEAGNRLGALLTTQKRFDEAQALAEWVVSAGHPEQGLQAQKLLENVSVLRRDPGVLG